MADSYELDAKAFAIPAVAFLGIGFTTAVAGIARDEPMALRALAYACLSSGVVATIVAAVYGWLAEDTRQRVGERGDLRSH